MLYRTSLILQKTPIKGYTETPRTIGEHVRKIRIDKGLTQSAVAKAIGVCEQTVNNWEQGREPALIHLPAIIRFLGYVPFTHPPVGDIVKHLDFFRRVNGLTYKRLGETMMRDEEQLTDWLSGRIKPSEKNMQFIQKWLTDKGVPNVAHQ